LQKQKPKTFSNEQDELDYMSHLAAQAKQASDLVAKEFPQDSVKSPQGKSPQTNKPSPATKLLRDVVETYELHLESICPSDSDLNVPTELMNACSSACWDPEALLKLTSSASSEVVIPTSKTTTWKWPTASDFFIQSLHFCKEDSEHICKLLDAVASNDRSGVDSYFKSVKESDLILP